MKHTTPHRKGSRQGFTITELVVSLGVFSMIISGLLSFNVQMIKGGLFSEQKNRINRDIRKITNEFNTIAKEANYFVLYDSYDEEDRDNRDDRLYTDKSGDFVVFVFTSPNYASLGAQPIERLVGYFRSAGQVDELSNVGPVKKFDIVYQQSIDIGSSGVATLESLFPAEESQMIEEVVELSKGLARDKLFYNFEKKSIMVNGQIYHGLAGNRVTDTYNFTISPRG